MEPIAAFGHEVLRLVALAYPDFTDEGSTVIARDVFLDGLHPSFQVPLRSKQKLRPQLLPLWCKKSNGYS